MTQTSKFLRYQSTKNMHAKTSATALLLFCPEVKLVCLQIAAQVESNLKAVLSVAVQPKAKISHTHFC